MLPQCWHTFHYMGTAAFIASKLQYLTTEVWLENIKNATMVFLIDSLNNSYRGKTKQFCVQNLKNEIPFRMTEEK